MDNRTTEQSSRYDNLDKMSTSEILLAMNAEDRTVPVAVSGAIPQIQKLVDGIVSRIPLGGRVFYLGAGIKKTRDRQKMFRWLLTEVFRIILYRSL